MSTTVFVLLSALLCIVAGQSWTADFTVTASPYNRGYFDGVVYYDYSTKSLKFEYPRSGLYSEIYKFKAADGGQSGSPYTGQFLFKSSSSCPCETLNLNSGFYPLVVSSFWTAVGIPETIDGRSCQRHNIATTITNSLIKSMWTDPSGTPCKFIHRDDRTFTLSRVVTKTSAEIAPNFQTPTGCKCGRPMDIVVSLDRSGSIDSTEWKSQKIFMQNLTDAFDYGPIACNMAVLNWNFNQWVTIKLIDGVTATAVKTAVNAMTCCPDSGGSCCCCGTPIGAGLYKAGQEILTSVRPLATKIIIILTDGCQNHYFDAVKNTAVSCGCSSEAACVDNVACKTDLENQYNLVLQNSPTVKILVIGVGTNTCPTQLSLVAGGKTENIFKVDTFEALSTLVQSISATACDLSNNPCTSTCCGICSCGVCLTPNGCVDPDKCTVTSIDATAGGCCKSEPRTCTAGACQVANCDPVSGCTTTPAACQPGTTCFNYQCNPTTSLCDPVPNGQCTVNYECKVAADCVNPAGCWTSYCNLSSTDGGNCVRTQTNCNVPSNRCVTGFCNRTAGVCSTIDNSSTCNDNNPCTDDSCVPATGCVNTPRNCDLPLVKAVDKCALFSCSRSANGCFTERKNCSSFNTSACFIWSCDGKTGACVNTSVCIIPPGVGGEETVAVVAGAVTGGAIAGICIAGAAALAAASGGAAYAYTSGAGAGANPEVGNNPLYKQPGSGAANPLFKQS